jgi:hypothetical protein
METGMATYGIEVTREGRWWMIHIPEIDGLPQARYPGEIERLARSYIAVTTGAPIEEIHLRRA